MIKIYEGGLRPEDIFDRSEEKNTVGDIVADIIANVRKNGDAALREMMKKSYDILVNHPINIERKKQGLNPANCCWFCNTTCYCKISSLSRAFFAEFTTLKVRNLNI